MKNVSNRQAHWSTLTKGIGWVYSPVTNRIWFIFLEGLNHDTDWFWVRVRSIYNCNEAGTVDETGEPI